LILLFKAKSKMDSRFRGNDDVWGSSGRLFAANGLARYRRNAQHRLSKTDIRGEPMRRYLWITTIVIAALAAGWWLGRDTAPARGSMVAESANADAKNSEADALSNAPKYPAVHAQSGTPTNQASASKSLPPPGAPLKQTFDELKARADAGDAEAASRLYRDLERCDEASSSANNIAALTQMAESENAISDIPGLIAHQEEIMRRHALLCEGLSAAQTEWRMSAMLRAAQLGDLGASNCYVSPGGLIDSPEIVNHPEWLIDFRNNALDLANSAVEYGDWGMVMQLANAYTDGSQVSMFGAPTGLLWQVTGQNGAMSYRYFKLASLGVPDDVNGRAYIETVADLGRKLSDGDRASADRWARNAYRDYFAQNPNNSAYQRFALCSSDSDGVN